MEWIEYELKFAEIAKKHNKSQNIVNDGWNMQKVVGSGIAYYFTQNHLCALLGYQPVYVYAVSNAPCNFLSLLQSAKKKWWNKKYI